LWATLAGEQALALSCPEGLEGKGMKLVQIIAFSAVLILIAARTGFCEGFTSGSELLDDCSSKGEPEIACIGYVTGVADSSNCQNHDSVGGFSWRPPPNVNRRQLGKIVLKWLNEHPESLHLLASGLVARALDETFPCK
jgi:Rap1a immunity proteins